MSTPPTAPHPSLVTFRPVQRRPLEVFGAPVEAVFVPGRRGRGNRAEGPRPALAASPAPRILAEEGYWRGEGLVLTPNKYPYAREHSLLWPASMRREPDARLWAAAAAWSARASGAAMSNTIGAAATIAWAHVHLTTERLAFLPRLPERVGRRGLVELPAGVEFVEKDLPCSLVGVRGDDHDAVGATLERLAAARLTSACNVCIQDGTAWLFPRRAETPAPHFPFAFGAAELWGRWCYVDEAAFTAATGQDLELALVAAGAPA